MGERGKSGEVPRESGGDRRLAKRLSILVAYQDCICVVQWTGMGGPFFRDCL